MFVWTDLWFWVTIYEPVLLLIYFAILLSYAKLLI